ncbi:pilus assembly PilX family protein [Billgrantia aerodenitrificans]|uniref:Type 4 fimbrial biogenesis protein PilX N-terminal domain-containing protein n=1 Tax=Billgrantia aerodenitrificans TaxID=2733483 RepID=A0ABS9AZ75_9GAMM|nr:PilX N-terminal domain-containing pilus assembly protein [Halomonas aerodenitrificans]MCE8027006.1 hypothetical protein [Halomonas aerodenitrificans]
MKQQGGAALVVVLSMLAMSLMLGISGMQSSQIDERLAGNYRASVLAQMAAEAGAAVAYERLVDSISDGFVISSVSACNAQFSNGLVYDVVAYQQGSDYSLAVCGSGGFYSLLSSGRVYSGADVISIRTVLVGAFEQGVGLLGLSPITVPGSIKNDASKDDPCYAGQKGNIPSFCFIPPSSQAEFVGEELVDGVYNPAITVRDPNDHDAIKNTIEKREENYIGGVEYGMSESLLESADKFSSFLSLVESCAKGQSPGCAGGRYFSHGASVGDFGSEENPQLTFYDGDFDAGGNFSGAGALIVRGDVKFSGTPNFSGIIIVLGTYTVSGGGSSSGQGGFKGSIVAAPMKQGEDGLEFSETSISISGGGGANYVYSAGALASAFDVLGEGAKDYWNENNSSTRKTGVIERDLSGWREIVYM